MVARLAAFVIWAAVAASAVYWGAKLLARPAPVPAHAVLPVAPAAVGGDLSRVLGADAPVPQRASAVPAADPRFRLIGVAAPRGKGPAAVGVALIATDGKAARAYRIGAVVDGDLVLQAVHARGASLGARGQPAQVVLVIIGVLAALIVPNVLDRADDARVTAARTDVANLMQALKLYKLDNQRYPTAEQGLEALVRKPTAGPAPAN